MKTIFILLIPYTVIDNFVCELIEIKGPTETRQPNASSTLDMAVLRNDYTNILNYTSVARDPLNFESNPWPNARIVQDRNPSLNFETSAGSTNFVPLPVTRMPKTLYTSANRPSIAPFEGRQIIPVGQSMYPGWEEISVKSNRTALKSKKSDQEESYDTTTANEQERDISLVLTNGFRHKEKRRKNEGTDRQYFGYDESTHGPDEDYTSPENYFSSSNYELDNTDANAQRYFSRSGRYGTENYNSYSTESNKNNRYYANSANVHLGSSDPWPLRHQRPNSVYSQFTDDSSYDDPARGGPSPSLISIFFAIGSNLLQLFKIGLGSGLSIAIPIIAIKLFLIPLKILKFIKVVKILLKLIFVVPFILRVFAPSIYSSIGYHDSGFSNKMGETSTPESRDVPEQASENSTWWNNLALNLTSALPDVVSSQKCPSRVACELGAYLASRNHISEKLIKYLTNDDAEESKDFNEERNEKEEVTRAFLRALTQRWTYDRCDVFACGISL